MSNTYLDKAIEAVPELGNRISLFTKKLRLAQYADSTIYSYRLKISQAVLYLKKLPDDFTQADVDDYLTMLLALSSVRIATVSASSLGSSSLPRGHHPLNSGVW